MSEKLWAELDDDWRRKEERAATQRVANMEAIREGRPLPYPNSWDELDPTKVSADSTPEQLAERHRQFTKLCRPFQPKRHTI